MSLSPIDPNFTQRPTGIRALDQHMRDSTRNDHPQYVLSQDQQTIPGVYLPETYGAKGDGSTDDTTSINAAVSAACTAGGGTILFAVGKTYLCSGQIVFPTTNITVSGGLNNGLTLPVQQPIRLTSFGGPAWNGYWTANLMNGSALLDLRYSSGPKILTLGAGFLEMDHLALKSGGSDNEQFFHTTNTTCFIHHCSVQGNTANTGRACQQDFFVAGGTSSTIGGASSDAFQGYGTKLSCNFYDHIRAGSTLQTFANAIVIEDETFSITCGSNVSTGGAYVLNFAAGGNTIRGALVEMSNQAGTGNYDYVVQLVSGNGDNVFDDLTAWDPTALTDPNLGIVYCGTSSVNNIIANCHGLAWTGGPEAAAQTLVGYDTGWIGVSFANSWVQGPGGPVCAWRQVDNEVILTGQISAGTPLAVCITGLPIPHQAATWPINQEEDIAVASIDTSGNLSIVLGSGNYYDLAAVRYMTN